MTVDDADGPRVMTRSGRGTRANLVLDGAERLIVLVLFTWLAWRLARNYWVGGQVVNLLILPSEGLVAVFTLLRRPALETSRRPADWLLALAATCAPLWVNPTSGSALLGPATGATLLLMGLMIQVIAKLALGRSFGLVAAHRGLKLGGPYRYVRHPMYAGYLLSHLAFLAMNPTLWNLVVYAICDGLQVPRLLAEERLLSHDARYAEYRSVVRYRLIPGLF